MSRWFASLAVALVALGIPTALTQFVFKPAMDVGSATILGALFGTLCGIGGGLIIVAIEPWRRS